MGWGRIPQASSCVDRRDEKVVLPEEEGPAICKPDVFPSGDLFGDVANLLLHHGLLGQDHLGGAAAGNRLIHLRHVGNAKLLGPKRGIIKGLKDLDRGVEFLPAAWGFFWLGRRRTKPSWNS